MSEATNLSKLDEAMSRMAAKAAEQSTQVVEETVVPVEAPDPEETPVVEVNNEADATTDQNTPQEAITEVVEDISSEWSAEEPQDPTEEVVLTEPNKVLEDFLKKLEVDFKKEDLNVDFLEKTISDKVKKEIDAFKADIPEKLQKAIELAKEGVDYEKFLTINNVDYNSFSDVDIYVNSVIDFFTDKDGNVDEAKLQDHVDSLSEVDIKIKSTQIRKSLESAKEAANLALIQEKEALKKHTEEGISKFLQEFKDVDGFKVTPIQKESIKKSVVNDSLVKDFFYEDGKISYRKIAENKFIVDNFKSIVKFLKTKSLNEGKRAVIASMTNPEVNVTSSPILENTTSTVSPQSLLIQEIKDRYKK